MSEEPTRHLCFEDGLRRGTSVAHLYSGMLHALNLPLAGCLSAMRRLQEDAVAPYLGQRRRAEYFALVTEGLLRFQEIVHSGLHFTPAESCTVGSIARSVRVLLRLAPATCELAVDCTDAAQRADRSVAANRVSTSHWMTFLVAARVHDLAQAGRSMHAVAVETGADGERIVVTLLGAHDRRAAATRAMGGTAEFTWPTSADAREILAQLRVGIAVHEAAESVRFEFTLPLDP